MSRLDHIDKQAVDIMTYVVAGETGLKVDTDVLQMATGNLMHLVTSNLEEAASNPK